MLDTETKRRIDTARDILVGKLPDPKGQVEQITIALIYKFMDDMDAEAEELGGHRKFFAGDFKRYGWANLMRSGLGGHEMLNLYAEAITKMPENDGIPPLFREIFKNAFLPYRDPETLREFLKVIDEFEYDHSERLGDAFEYLLSVLGSQGDAGQFRTPRHIIDFVVAVLDPKKSETVLDPACGTAGFLISAYKHILRANSSPEAIEEEKGEEAEEAALDSSRIPPARGDLLTPDERASLAANFKGYDISPDMVRLSRVNLYLHGFTDPHIYEYDTLTSQERWNEHADVILANPPFMSPKGGIKPHNRFSVQSKRSEVLFVDYMAEHLTPAGRAGIIVPEGIIFQNQSAYIQLRKMLVEEYLVAVISLPAGVFNPYSGVKTSILILDRSLAKQSETVGFFKVEHDGFNLGAQRRPISRSDLPPVGAEATEYLQRLRGQVSLEGFQPSHGLIVAKESIRESDGYNLNGDRYRAVVPREARFQKVCLGDLLKLEFGKRITKREHEGTLYPVFGGGGESFKTDNATHGDDVVISRFAMSPECVRVVQGKFYLLDSGFTFSISDQYASRALKSYVTLVLLNLQDEIYSCGRGHAQKNIDLEAFRAINIPLPPLEVQDEIVREIGHYQSTIRAANSVLESYRPQVPLSVDWPQVELGTVCTKIQYGLSVPLNTGEVGFKTFRMNELVGGKCVDGGDMKRAAISSAEFEKYKLSRGDILFNRTNSFEHVGRTGIFDLEGEYCFASYLIRLSVDETRVDPRFVNAFMNSDSFQRGIKQFASRAIGQANINAKSLSGYPIPLPSIEAQKDIVADLEREETLVEANRELVARFDRRITAVLARIWTDVSASRVS